MKERSKFLIIVGVFLAAYFVPVHHVRVESATLEAFHMLQEYAREHVLFCLVPAFFIAGAISVFVSQAAVMRYFGAQAKRVVAYGVASVSGAILAVCSCTVLPLFAGIYTRGAGIGPAIAFLYSGPAINVLAIILTARVLGWELGAARAVGAVVFSIVIGLMMAFIYRKEEAERQANASNGLVLPDSQERPSRTLLQDGSFFLAQVGVLVFAAWGQPKGQVAWWDAVARLHWPLAGLFLVAVLVMAWGWMVKEERKGWVASTWEFAKLILPLLFFGVLAAGFLMGRPGADSGLIPARWVSGLVGGNSVTANLFASVSGALMYFATLTEVPILEGLIGSGMGKGPALALLLAGPAVSLPNLLVLRSVMGTRKTLVYCLLVVMMSTLSGLIFGSVMS